MSGGDHIHAGTVVGKLEGEREMTLGFVDLLRDDFIEKDRARGVLLDRGPRSLLLPKERRSPCRAPMDVVRVGGVLLDGVVAHQAGQANAQR
jgi:hypothetical protein